MSGIISSGGWKSSRVVRLRVKAWIALLLAAGLGCVAVFATDMVLIQFWIAGVVGLIASVVLFVREKPAAIGTIARRARRDPRKLYVRGRIRR